MANEMKGVEVPLSGDMHDILDGAGSPQDPRNCPGRGYAMPLVPPLGKGLTPRVVH